MSDPMNMLQSDAGLAAAISGELAMVSEPEEENGGLSQDDWDALLTAIRMGKCTPFLGAGASIPYVRSAAQIAQDWAASKEFPFPNRSELIKVAQYLSVRKSPLNSKELMVRECDVVEPAFTRNSLYDVLSDLEIPIYMTTNYDSLLSYALKGKMREPQREICRWSGDLTLDSPLGRMLESPLARGVRPTKQTPLVFHFHGHFSCPESLVLDEDDYLDFLQYVSTHPDTIPPQVQASLVTGSVLFLGYSLSDWTIQVIFRGITQYLSLSRKGPHVSVQLVPPLGERPTADQRVRAREYLKKYFGRQNVSVYWGTCDQFAADLRSQLHLSARH